MQDISPLAQFIVILESVPQRHWHGPNGLAKGMGPIGLNPIAHFLFQRFIPLCTKTFRQERVDWHFWPYFYEPLSILILLFSSRSESSISSFVSSSAFSSSCNLYTNFLIFPIPFYLKVSMISKPNLPTFRFIFSSCSETSIFFVSHFPQIF